MAINVKKIAEVNLDKVIISQITIDQVTQGQSTDKLMNLTIDNQGNIITEE